MRPCVFCGSQEKATKEDVVPRWALRTLDIRGPVTVTASDRPGAPRRQVGRPMDALQVILMDALCARCHNAWLGGTIEKPVSRLLKPMIREAQTALLDAAAQRLLSFWAVKTALLLEPALRQLHPGERPVEGYVASEVQLAYLWRHSKPPPRSMAWLGSFDCEHGKPLIYEPSSAVLPTADGSHVEGHLATWATPPSRCSPSISLLPSSTRPTCGIPTSRGRCRSTWRGSGRRSWSHRTWDGRPSSSPATSGAAWSPGTASCGRAA
jgi:hypothetical protein